MSGYVKPTAEQIAQEMYEHDRAKGDSPAWDGLFDDHIRQHYLSGARAVLALLSGRTEAEVRASIAADIRRLERNASTAAGWSNKVYGAWNAAILEATAVAEADDQRRASPTTLPADTRMNGDQS